MLLHCCQKIQAFLAKCRLGKRLRMLTMRTHLGLKRSGGQDQEACQEIDLVVLPEVHRLELPEECRLIECRSVCLLVRLLVD